MRGGGLGRLRRHALQPTFVAAALATVFAAACHDTRPAVVVQPKTGAAVAVYVEVADTPDTQTRGLMYRAHLAPDDGMIFLFDREQNHSFWMKNTSLPLDMLIVFGVLVVAVVVFLYVFSHSSGDAAAREELAGHALRYFYIFSAFLFILGLKGLSSPRYARRGMFLAEFGMVLAIAGTLFHPEIKSYHWLIVGMVKKREIRKRNH